MTVASSHAAMRAADVLIHEAGHAVIAWELGVRVGQVVVDGTRRQGHVKFVSDTLIGRFAPRSASCRRAAERDMVVCHAGFMAQRRFHYDGTLGWYPLEDYMTIQRVAEEFTDDAALIDAWSAYLEDRARQMVEHPATWTRILALALELARRAGVEGVTEVDGEAIEEFLGRVRVPATNALLAYRRRLGLGIYVVLEGTTSRDRFCNRIERAYSRGSHA
jgi:hypothetical protein